MKTLSIIGCGKLAKTLGYLWQQQEVFRIGDILNRSEESGRQAVHFLGSGRVVTCFADLKPADFYLIATVDDALVSHCEQLVAQQLLRKDDIVFHCSGLAPSTLLQSAANQGARIASVHPIKSFAVPDEAVTSFAGTFCAVEGDPTALPPLEAALTAIGGNCFALSTERKALYHAGMVVISNFLTTLLDVGGRILAESGLTHEQAFQVIEPIVKGVVDNVFTLGSESSLTGPYSRGDVATIQQHLASLKETEALFESVYRTLGRATLDLSRRQGTALPERLDQLTEILEQQSR